MFVFILCGYNLLCDFDDCCFNRIVGFSVLVIFGVIGDLLCKKLMFVVYDFVN